MTEEQADTLKSLCERLERVASMLECAEPQTPEGRANKRFAVASQNIVRAILQAAEWLPEEHRALCAKGCEGFNAARELHRRGLDDCTGYAAAMVSLARILAACLPTLALCGIAHPPDSSTPPMAAPVEGREA